jgi:hypothetical protein
MLVHGWLQTVATNHVSHLNGSSLFMLTRGGDLNLNCPTQPEGLRSLARPPFTKLINTHTPRTSTW